MDAVAMHSTDRADTPPFREFLAHGYTRRKRACAILVIVLGLFILVAGIMPARYQADAVLAVLPAPEFTVRPDAGSSTMNGGALAMDQLMKAETDILASKDLHAAVIQAIGLKRIYPDLADQTGPGGLHAWLRLLINPWLGPAGGGPGAAMELALRRFDHDLDLHASKEGNVVTVAFTALDGALAADTVEQLLATYALRRSRLYDDPQLGIVTSQADEVSLAAIQADARLAAFKAAHAISNYEEERSILLKRRSDAAQDLAIADMSAAEQQARITALDRQISGLTTTQDIYRERDPDSRLQALDAALLDLRTRLSVARARYQDTSRMVTDLTGQIAMRMDERRRLASDGSVSVQRYGPNPVADQLKLDRSRATAELAAADARALSLRKYLADLAAAIAAADTNEQALDGLQRQKMVADQNVMAANKVMAERRMTEQEDSLRLAKVRVIQGPRVPQRPGALKLLMIVAGGLLGSVAAAVFIVMSFVARPTFLTAAGLAHATGLPVLGVFHEPEGDRAAAFAS